ncbi:winged helix DNA-binding domain-containing protein [Mucilaginibacter sp. McL0603]|uniref:winged helix DNA-binding domain-containing protein n=1 Tax=Mucilaginibacter sp. McL0603 TaxID=3415670 RepID=UPI003CF7AEC7
MTVADIREQRLLNQHLASPIFTNPADIVYYMGAIQAQDYSGAKWAIAQRLQGATDALIEKAFTDGDIIRTHVMRPTWHFVHPEDIRWMLQLTSARVQATASTYYKQHQLDHKVFSDSEKAIALALQGSKQLMRDEVADVLQQAGIATNELRFIHIMMQMELIGLVCSGGRQGKQFTYTLFDERVPSTKVIDRQDALAALTERYFTSHGPATLQDYVWWSGLTVVDAKTGLEMVKHKLSSETIDGNAYWFTERLDAPENKTPTTFLLPNYDEYIVSYKDRSASIESSDINKADPRGTIFNHTIIINGRICAIWKRTIGTNKVDIEVIPFKPLSKVNQAAITSAAKRYAKFSGVKDVKLHIR